MFVLLLLLSGYHCCHGYLVCQCTNVPTFVTTVTMSCSPDISFPHCHLSFLEVKRPGRDVDYPPPSSAEVKKKSRTLLPLWAFMACSGMKFTYTFTVNMKGI